MAPTAWLIDTSAVARVGASVDAAHWADRIQRGLVRVASITRVELGYSARSASELRGERREGALSLMPVEYLTPSVENRAEQVQELLADRGLHRAPSLVDLLLAATAERAGLTVLHVDKDFDLIAAVTGQPLERLRLPDEDS